MSWSIAFTGTPQDVVTLLEGHGQAIGHGPSKDEYEKAKPAIVELVKLNSGTGVQIVRLSANGSTYDNGQGPYSQVNVNLERVYTNPVPLL